MGWIIYISGFIVTYICCKLIRNTIDKNDWEDVFITIFLSLFSWVSFILIGVLALFVYLTETIKLKNPPKWL